MVRAIENAKATDEEFRKLTEGFSLKVAYVIGDLPPKLREQHNSGEVVIFVELAEGAMRGLAVGTRVPDDKKPDFTVRSDYAMAKKIFLGEINPATAFIKRQFKAEPFRKLYMDPAFTAKSIVTANAILRVIKDIPTAFPE